MKTFIKAVIWLVVIAVLIFGGKYSYDKIEKMIYPQDYKSLIEAYSEEYGLDKSLVYAVVKCESGFDSNAVSSIGAKGLMQLTDETYEWVCSRYKDNSDKDLFIPEVNIKAGCRLLRLHLKEFGNVKTALAAYHAGRGITNRWLKNPDYSSDGETLDKVPYEETSKYIDRVVKTIDKYKEIYNIK